MAKLHAIELAITLATRQRDALRAKARPGTAQWRICAGPVGPAAGLCPRDRRPLGGRASSPALGRSWCATYQFADRLLQAANLQEGVIANLDRQQAHAHQLLLQAEFKLAGLQQALKTRQALLRRAQQRSDQRANDGDSAALRHLRARAQLASH